jgi:hypothetical protein
MIEKLTLNVGGVHTSSPWKAYDITNRIDDIIKKTLKYDVVALCEIPTDMLDECMTKLEKHFNWIYYLQYSHLYYYVVASQIECIDDDIAIMMDDNRSAVGLTYMVDDCVIIDVTCHMPVNPIKQVECYTNLKTSIDRKHQQLLALYPNVQVILTGDFNSLPGCENNLNTFSGYNHLTLPITFRAYPFDYGLSTDITIAKKEEIDRTRVLPAAKRKLHAEAIIELYGAPITSCLDHAFTTFEDASIRNVVIDVSNDSFVDLAQKAIPTGLSDHYPIIIRV